MQGKPCPNDPCCLATCQDVPQDQNTPQHLKTHAKCITHANVWRSNYACIEPYATHDDYKLHGGTYMICGDYNVLFKAPGSICQCLEWHRHYSRVIRYLLMQVPVQLLPYNLHDTSALLTTPSKSHHTSASTGDRSTIRLQYRLLQCDTKPHCPGNKPTLLKPALRIRPPGLNISACQKQCLCVWEMA